MAFQGEIIDFSHKLSTYDRRLQQKNWYMQLWISRNSIVVFVCLCEQTVIPGIARISRIFSVMIATKQFTTGLFRCMASLESF